jgi:hypothetical protein
VLIRHDTLLRNEWRKTGEHFREESIRQNPKQMNDRWYEIANVDDVDSPALLVYPDRAEENIRRMITIVGDVRRLRPHMKTHKLPEIIRMQLAHGITKFKCATIAEAEMPADCGAADVLLAHQLIGPKVQRFIQLLKKFPQTNSRPSPTMRGVIHALSAACAKPRGVSGSVARALIAACTGRECAARAVDPLPNYSALPGAEAGRLHAYDGRIREATRQARRFATAFAPVTRCEGVADGVRRATRCRRRNADFSIHARDKELSAVLDVRLLGCRLRREMSGHGFSERVTGFDSRGQQAGREPPLP